MEKTETKRTHIVWLEGYAISGNSSVAVYLGQVEAGTFADACETAIKARKYDMKHFKRHNDNECSYWGCKFFDNESEARASFG